MLEKLIHLLISTSVFKNWVSCVISSVAKRFYMASSDLLSFVTGLSEQSKNKMATTTRSTYEEVTTSQRNRPGKTSASQSNYAKNFKNCKIQYGSHT